MELTGIKGRDFIGPEALGVCQDTAGLRTIIHAF